MARSFTPTNYNGATIRIAIVVASFRLVGPVTTVRPKVIWRRRPVAIAAEIFKGVQKPAAEGFVRYLKRHAGGSVRSNRGQNWPVLTGFSRNRFRVIGRGRGHVLFGASYAPDVDARGPDAGGRASRRGSGFRNLSASGSIVLTVWSRFATGPEMLKILRDAVPKSRRKGARVSVTPSLEELISGGD